jgi:hypothetical protein
MSLDFAPGATVTALVISFGYPYFCKPPKMVNLQCATRRGDIPDRKWFLVVCAEAGDAAFVRD